MSEIILKLQEEQYMHALKKKWFKEKDGGGKCIGQTKKVSNALDMKNVGGVFVVMIGGMGFALIVAVGEFVYTAHRNSREDNVSICPFRFYICWTDHLITCVYGVYYCENNTYSESNFM